MRITLLGTGGPELSVDRSGIATLIEAAGEILLFDAGRGVMQRLYECGVRINSVTNVFFTHLHSDHIEGLPNLWFTPWFLLGRETHMRFWGPLKTAAVLAGMRQFLEHDIEARSEEHLSAEHLAFEVFEFEGSTTIYESGGVTVKTVPVDHKDGNPAFGFVIEHDGRRVILSGDCTYSDALARCGDADVVLHNVFSPSAALLSRDPFKKTVSEKLASPEQAASVFRQTHARLGVYTHVIPMDSSSETIIQRTRSGGFHGPLVIGADRMRIDVGHTVEVLKPSSLSDVREVTSRGHG